MFITKARHEREMALLHAKLATVEADRRKVGRLASEALSERDALQAKVDRMTSGLRNVGRKAANDASATV